MLVTVALPLADESDMIALAVIDYCCVNAVFSAASKRIKLKHTVDLFMLSSRSKRFIYTTRQISLISTHPTDLLHLRTSPEFEVEILEIFCGEHAWFWWLVCPSQLQYITQPPGGGLMHGGKREYSTYGKVGAMMNKIP
jgi:hypothetical protein